MPNGTIYDFLGDKPTANRPHLASCMLCYFRNSNFEFVFLRFMALPLGWNTFTETASFMET
ncbi:hypothetical protein J132_07073 [Termitomyces sp. J132]|nr:hypothetical protein J132_07073 [Termitomyces sp. J132]